MTEEFIRSAILLGDNNLQKLQNAHVAVFGIGGVGGYIVEALARSSVGTIDLIDNDIISLSNINRQIIALHSTIGMLKTEVAKQRALDINPHIKINCHNCFFLPENASQVNFAQYDYVADAIDTVSGKISLAEQAYKTNTPIISAMGAGNKLDGTAFKVSDISKTKVCPLAKVMRKELRKRGIEHLKVVYSEEIPLMPKKIDDNSNLRQTPGSVAFVPPIVGLLMAGEIIKDIIYRD